MTNLKIELADLFLKICELQEQIKDLTQQYNNKCEELYKEYKNGKNEA